MSSPSRLISGNMGRAPLASMGSEIAAAVATPSSLQEMLDRCARAVVTNLNAALARIWLLGPRGENLSLEASAGEYSPLDAAQRRLPVGQHNIGLVAQERRPYVTDDLAGEPSVSDPEWVRRGRLTSFAGFPLLIGERLIGVLAVFGRRPFPNDAIEALGTASSAVAVGIERNRLEEQLRNGQKLEAVGRLAGGVAHDFNNILTVITGYTELLLRRPGMDEVSTNILREIYKAGDRAAGLTRQLLAFSRRQVLETRVLDLNALVVDMEKMLCRLIGEDIRLTTRLDPSLGAVKADAGQLEQVVMNLVVNARDSMPQGGGLTIETANVENDAGRARAHPDLPRGAYVKLSVSDQGCGMTRDVISRIFEPFFTTKRPGKGTGLGLATVYGIVKQSGGHVAVSSRPGTGTTFDVFIPRAKEPSRPRPHVLTPRASLRASSRGGETILLVEDEGAVRAFAREVLIACGYTILEASDGREALLVAGRSGDPIDLLLTDVIMPEMAGRALTNALASRRPAMRVLYMSGYMDDDVIRHGVLVAGTNFIHKPFTPDALASKVREILDRKASRGAGARR